MSSLAQAARSGGPAATDLYPILATVALPSFAGLRRNAPGMHPPAALQSLASRLPSLLGTQSHS